MPESEPVVLIKPNPFSNLFNQKYKYFLAGFFIVAICILVLYLAMQQPAKPKILAFVNEEPVTEQFLKDKIAKECLVSKSDTQTKALEKWIDFLVLKKGAKDLGIEVNQEEIQQKVDKRNNPQVKNCPEQFQNQLLRIDIKKKIMPYRRVEHLIVDKNKKNILDKLRKSYDIKTYPSLLSAAKKFLYDPKEASNSAVYSVFQGIITADIGEVGIYNRQIIREIFELKPNALSQVSTISNGSYKDKLMIIKVLESGDENKSLSFTEWFNQTKNKTKIVVSK